MEENMRKLLCLAAVAALSLGFLLADSGPNHQVRNMHFGVSGGNVNDVTKRFCCSGTLGSLLTDGTAQYVLSNNHILARQDRAAAGEDISQPGLVDNNCSTPPIVADFTTAVPLGNNVDAAIAQVRAGQMDATGYIEDVGLLLTNVRPPSVGLPVAKSGRTTGGTTGTLTSINTNVNVQYQRSCGQGKKYVLSYTNQVVAQAASGAFSGGGDSGALIVSVTGAFPCAQPVALLFAGNATQTIGNPIGEVLTKLDASLGRPLSFVGRTDCPLAAAGPESLSPAPTQNDVDFATMIKDRHAPDLMAQPEIIGVGVGARDDHPEQAAVVIYVDSTRPAHPRLPESLDGVPVKVVATQPFVAY
jgi:hypothetical protein